MYFKTWKDRKYQYWKSSSLLFIWHFFTVLCLCSFFLTLLLLLPVFFSPWCTHSRDIVTSSWSHKRCLLKCRYSAASILFARWFPLNVCGLLCFTMVISWWTTSWVACFWFLWSCCAPTGPITSDPLHGSTDIHVHCASVLCADNRNLTVMAESSDSGAVTFPRMNISE